MMIDLAGTEPFLRCQLPDVVASMLQIAEAPGPEDGTRHLAIEFVTLVASNTILSMAAEVLRSQRALLR